MNANFCFSLFPMACCVHPPDSKVGRVSEMGEDMLFRVRLAFQGDEAALAKLVPGSLVCRTCASHAMRELKKRFGKDWRQQVQKRRREQREPERAAAEVVEAAKHSSKRVRVDDAGLRFAPSPDEGEHRHLFHAGPHERLGDLFRFPALFEINAYFVELGYPAMVAGPDTLLHEPLWHGLCAIAPGASRRAVDLVRRDQQTTAAEVREFMRMVPRSGVRIVAALGNVIAAQENAGLTRMFVELLCRCAQDAATRLPLFFGRRLTESQLERILAAVASSPSLRIAADTPGAFLWTDDFDPPTLVSLAGLVELPASCRVLQAALSKRIRIPASHLRLCDPLSGHELAPDDAVHRHLLHFVVVPT
jgi:hypothetical protein